MTQNIHANGLDISSPLLKRTILLVDDNPDIVEILGVALEDYGFEVLTASDGLEAVGLFMKDPHRIDLLVSDVLMPKMNGDEAYQIMRRIKQDLRVIFISGYSNAENMGIEGYISSPEIIPKPFWPKHLISKIHEILEC